MSEPSKVTWVGPAAMLIGIIFFSAAIFWRGFFMGSFPPIWLELVLFIAMLCVLILFANGAARFFTDSEQE